jgi:hypothetical protein
VPASVLVARLIVRLPYLLAVPLLRNPPATIGRALESSRTTDPLIAFPPLALSAVPFVEASAWVRVQVGPRV